MSLGSDPADDTAPLRDATYDARQERRQRELEEATRLAEAHGVTPDLARPVGKLYGDSLLAQLDRRKAAMKAKQRAGVGDDGRRNMEAVFGPDTIVRQLNCRPLRLRAITAVTAGCPRVRLPS